MFRFFTCSPAYSEVRQASARMVSVGFLSALLTKGAASVTNRFLQSHAWQYEFSTDVLRIVAHAGGAHLVDDGCRPWRFPSCSLRRRFVTTCRRRSMMISRKVSCACRACRISSWLHLKWNLQHRNAPLVHGVRIDFAVAVVIGDHLAAAGEADEGAVDLAHAALQFHAIAAAQNTARNRRKFARPGMPAPAAEFDVIAAREGQLVPAFCFW